MSLGCRGLSPSEQRQVRTSSARAQNFILRSAALLEATSAWVIGNVGDFECQELVGCEPRARGL